MSTKLNNNFDSPPRPIETITKVSKLRHATTYNLSKESISNINITKNIAFDFLDHAIECDHCAIRINNILKKRGSKLNV